METQTAPEGTADSSAAAGDLQLTAIEYRLLVEHSPVMIWRADPSKQCDYFNRTWLEFTGRTMAQELGDGWAEGVHPDDLDRCVSVYVSSFERRLPFEMEYRLRRHDGQYRWIFDRGVPYWGDQGAFLGYIGSCVDVTERREAEQRSLDLAAERAARKEIERNQVELREHEARFRTLANAIPQLAWMADASGGRYWFNQRWFDYTGTTFDRVRGWGWQCVHHPDHVERVRTKIQRSLATGEPWEDTLPLRGGDGEYRWFLTRMVPTRAAGGAIVGWLGTNTDITELLAAENERQTLLEREREARANAEGAIRARDQFVAQLAHDLRNPLMGASGQVQMVRRIFRRGDTLSTEELLSRLDGIEASLKGVSAVIDELHDATRLRAGRPLELRCGPTDLVALAQEAVRRSQQTSEAHHIQLRCAEPSLVGVWDADRLQRVAGNLLANAVKYSPSGGVITVEVRREPGEAVLAVNDQGVGIPAQDLPHVFERYQRASNVGRIGGSGLGLAGAKEIVEQHGGSISARSAEGQGSTFIVRLPLAPAAAGPIEHTPGGHNATGTDNA